VSILFPNAPGSPADLADAARRLADDLAALAEGRDPDPAVLAAAPLLDLWRPATRPAAALIGLATGHPTVRDGRTSLTTEVFALDPTHGWARTWSRFYQLGRAVGVDPRRRQ
jgi:hypothetical protein